jgi:U3 small nucleolar RNA-associated protein 7
MTRTRTVKPSIPHDNSVRQVTILSFLNMADIMEDIRPEKSRTAYHNGSVPIKRARTELITTSDAALIRKKQAEEEYGRGKKISLRNIRDKKLRGNLKSLEKKYQDATLKAKGAEILLENEEGFLEPEGELERTWKVSQAEIQKNVAVQTAQMGNFQLKMEEMGPYVSEYSRNGRHLLIAGRKGHVATMDWRDGKLGCELQLGETVRDARWLQNHQAFAVAQKKYVYIYDQAGVEIHVLKKHIEVTNMEYLPYHHLLCTVVCIA